MKRFTLLSMSLATMLAASAAITAHGEIIITHRYDFEDNANDSVGALNGTVSTGDNAVSYDTISYKSGSSSLLTSGNGGWVDVPAYDFGNQFSIAAWVMPSSQKEVFPYYQVIATNADGGGGNGFRIYYNNWSSWADRTLHLEASVSGTQNAVFTGNYAVTEDQWNHVVATFDKTNNSYKLYVNGQLVANGSLGLDFQTSSAWRIGAFVGGDGYQAIKGGIDDVQVYSGVLGLQQVDYLYDHPGAAIPEPSAMVLLGVGAASLLANARRKRK
ncbi:MAG: LamG-like jellyroll fold domain-containing protein [Lentisphaeria bacterium]